MLTPNLDFLKIIHSGSDFRQQTIKNGWCNANVDDYSAFEDIRKPVVIVVFTALIQH